MPFKPVEGVSTIPKPSLQAPPQGIVRRQDLARLFAELTVHYLKHKLSALASFEAANPQSFLRARGALVTLPGAPSVENSQNPSWDHCINSVKNTMLADSTSLTSGSPVPSALTAPVACPTSSSNMLWLWNVYVNKTAELQLKTSL